MNDEQVERWQPPPRQPPALTEQEAVAIGNYLLSMQCRPLDYVLSVYPWGQPGSPLERRFPEKWQYQFLKDLQDVLLKEVAPHSSDPTFNFVDRISTVTGHGVGKTTLAAWLVEWWTSTHPQTQTVVTANTQTQLRTKTWRELAKWNAMNNFGWMFEWSAESYRNRGMPKTWYASAIPWSDANSAAFAGTHERYVMVIFDEASGISNQIWEVVEGALTSGVCLFATFGNPTENAGGFFDAHHSKKHLYRRYYVDSREVTFTNKAELKLKEEAWGYDSDFFRVRVRGVFPKQSARQFISSEAVAEAQQRKVAWNSIPRSIPLLMGIDVARQGTDSTVVILRKGRRVHERIKEYRERDSMKLANYLLRDINESRPDHVFIDAVGLGGPIYDRLVQLGVNNISEVVGGATSPMTERERKVCANMRAVMWSRMREWMATASLPEHPLLGRDLCTPYFDFRSGTDLLLIESKDDIRARGGASPDFADALANTFWELVPIRMTSSALGGGRSAEPEAV